MPEQLFVVSAAQHRLLGKQVKLQFADDFVLKLSPAEASSLSFALVAVRVGASPEREIYMSPIASDAAFVGTVLGSGMSIATPKGALELDWPNVGMLAEKLAQVI
jgi:hypothetical protein